MSESEIQVGHHVRVANGEGVLRFEGVVVGVGPIDDYSAVRAFDIARDDGVPGCGVRTPDGKLSYRVWKDDDFPVTRTYREVIDPDLKVGDRVAVVVSVQDEGTRYVDFVGTVVGVGSYEVDPRRVVDIERDDGVRGGGVHGTWTIATWCLEDGRYRSVRRLRDVAEDVTNVWDLI